MKIIVRLLALCALALVIPADAIAQNRELPKARTGNPIVDLLYGKSGVYVTNSARSVVTVQIGKKVWVDDLSGRHWSVIPLGTIGTIEPGHGMRVLSAGFRNGENMVLTVTYLCDGKPRVDARTFQVSYGNGRPWVREWHVR